MNIKNSIKMEPVLWALPIILLTMILLKVPEFSILLRFDRAGIDLGEIWRIFSCHFVHASFEHLFWDLLIFIFIGYLCFMRDKLKLLTCIVASILIIPFSIYILKPDLQYYIGLSGIDSAIFILFVSLLIREYMHEKDWKKVLILSTLYILFMIKIYYEMTNANGVFVDTQSVNMVPIPLAHLIGALIGGVIAYLPNTTQKNEAKK